MQVSAMVLAGGSSRRMGADKALLDLGGKPLIIWVLDAVSAISSDVIVVADQRTRWGEFPARVVEDREPGRGPLMGLYSGLRAARFPSALCVACDMPFLRLDLLRYMLGLRKGFDAVVLGSDPAAPRDSSEGDRVQPLHAIYRRACLPEIEELLDKGERRLELLLPLVRVRYVPWAEREAFDPLDISAWNLNSEADLRRAREFLLESKMKR